MRNDLGEMQKTVIEKINIEKLKKEGGEHSIMLENKYFILN